MTTYKYKKLFALSIYFLLLFLAVPAYAEEKPVIGVSTIYEGTKGKSVEVAIYINSTEPIAGGQLDLEYDPSAITISNEIAGDALPAYPNSSVFIQQPGKVSLTWAKGVGEQVDGTLLKFTAKLTNANETIPLNLKNVQLFKEDWSSIDVDLFNGEIKPFPSNGEQKKHPSKIESTKEWTVKFNTAINSKSFNKHTVKVKDSRGYAVDLKIEQIDNQTFKLIPKKPYIRGGTYKLEVSEQVRSVGGKKLKAPWQYEFTVQ